MRFVELTCDDSKGTRVFRMVQVVKLVKATVLGLFGRYSHSIEFGSEDEFLILYGPNGVGKTKFLEIIFSSASLNYFALEPLPFSFAELVYSDGTILTVSRNRVEKEIELSRWSGTKITFEISIEGKDAKEWQPIPEKFYDTLSRRSGLVQTSDGEWEDIRRGEKYSVSELYRKYVARQSYGREDQTELGEFDELPELFAEFRARTSCYLIDSQRLLAEQYIAARGGRGYGYDRDRRAVLRARISEYSEKVKEKLDRAQAEHSRLSQQKDRSFPSRVLKEAEGKVSQDPSTIRERYKEQSEFRERLAKVVSVDLSERLELPERDLDNWELALLHLYVNDTEEKFAPFANLLERIELLQKIVNKRLLNKQLEVTASGGLLVRRDDGERIALDALSTGEQHEIILMFDLLLNVESGATVLIDEPEISLHIAWQLSFIPDVRRIAGLVGFRFLVATHSPHIINGEWDRALDLGSDGGFSNA